MNCMHRTERDLQHSTVQLYCHRGLCFNVNVGQIYNESVDNHLHISFIRTEKQNCMSLKASTTEKHREKVQRDRIKSAQSDERIKVSLRES